MDSFPGAHWPAFQPRDAGLDDVNLSRGLDELGPHAGNVAVIRHGRLVAARGRIDLPVAQFSASKSLTAMVFASLHQRGLANYDDQLEGSDDPCQPRATFRQFMSMTSDFGLTPHQPGMYYAYNNNAVHFYGRQMAHRFFGDSPPDKVVQTAFFQAIGHEDPVTFTGQWGGWDGGFHVSARDMARAGYLVLRGGQWEQQQLLSPWYCRQVFMSQISADARPNFDKGPWDKSNQHAYTIPLRDNYSFGWWLWDKTGEQADAAYMHGRGGSMVVLSRRLDLVVAVTNDQLEPYLVPVSYLRKVEQSLRDGAAPTHIREL